MAQTPPARSGDRDQNDAAPASPLRFGAALLGAFVSALCVGAIYEHRIREAAPVCAQSSLVQVMPVVEGASGDPRLTATGARGMRSDADIIEGASADPEALKTLAIRQAEELQRLRNELATRHACAQQPGTGGEPDSRAEPTAR